jgi:nicotinate-nucleotide--dimethylbenzimidazole phosphoribosyltransferase
MTQEEAHKAVLSGFELASSQIRQGVELLGAGDMGIGNTTASAAIGAAVKVMTGVTTFEEAQVAEKE